jgi:hypothetical protein
MQTDSPKADPPKRNRRWFQFRPRTLMIVVTLLALVCGYATHEAKIVAARKALLENISNIPGGGYVISQGSTLTIVGNISRQDWGNIIMPRSDRGPTALREWLGDQRIDSVWSPYPQASIEDAKILVLFPESEIHRPLMAKRLPNTG